MTQSAIPATVDQIISSIGALDVLEPAQSYSTAFTDGIPEPDIAEVVVSIGGIGDTMATRTTRWAECGYPLLHQWEEFSVHGDVAAWAGGDGLEPETASDAQKTARDRAFAVINAIDNLLRTDPTLGGVLSASEVSTCGWARFSTLDVQETTEDEAAQGRQCTVLFQIDCIARI